MSLPEITLLSGIQTPLNPDVSFTLDSADFGVLDTDVLIGSVDTEIDASLIRSISINRGRSRQLDRFNAGSASILFDNRERLFDPLNEFSPYAGYIIPRLSIKLFADGIPIFTGQTTDWEVDYDITFNDEASAACSDGFGVLSNYYFTSDATPGIEGPGSRLTWVASTFGYPGETNFSPGNANLGAFEVKKNTQVMDYMFRVARSDLGLLFIDAEGVLTYVGRFDREPVSVVQFSDDGTGIPYRSLINQYGDELLYSQVVATSEAGTVVVEDATSLERFGLSVLDLSDLLNDSEGQLTIIAEDFLDIYKSPQVRFTGLTVELAALSAEQVEDVLSLDLAQQISVKKTFRTGGPLVVEQDLIVSGINHQIRPGSHVVSFTFERSNYGTGFTLDDVERGKLDDVNVLR